MLVYELTMTTIQRDSETLDHLPSICAAAGVTMADLEALPRTSSLSRVLEAYDDRLTELQRTIDGLELRSIAEQCLLSVGDNLIDGVCVVNLDGRVVSVNKSYTQLTEHSEEEVVGQSVHDLLKEGKIRVTITTQVMAERKRISVLCANPHGDKTYLITGLPLYDKRGELRGAMTILRDMTEITTVAHSLEQPDDMRGAIDADFKLIDYEPTRQGRLIGESQKVRKLKELIQYIARNDSSILLLGETGTGKEVVSREIHELSSRAAKPYIRVNCAALPESLIESELFGYERGAFTGAQSKAKPGLFELANGGTILLDEITDLPLQLQSKLLRVLQEREVMRLGGTRSVKLDVRVIAATNKDFRELIKNGEFRADLYYRLNVVPIRLIPLRDRKDDIPLFVRHFLTVFNVKYGAAKAMDADALVRLQQHSWPGNVRELENMIERIIASCLDERITVDHIDDLLLEAEEIASGHRPVDDRPGQRASSVERDARLKDNVNSFERDLLAEALREHGSTYKAAKALGISQSTVFRKATMYGLLPRG